MRKPSNCTLVVATLMALLAIPLLYVLSSGPAFWLSGHDYLDEAYLPRIYRPIHWGIAKSEWFRHFMWDYLELWDASMQLRSVDPFQPPIRLEDYPELIDIAPLPSRET